MYVTIIFLLQTQEDPQAVQWLQRLLDRLSDAGVEGASLPVTGPAEGGSAPSPGAATIGGGGGFLGNSIWEWREETDGIATHYSNATSSCEVQAPVRPE
jgi:hypothetical protein